jgi:AcrR family transcriptional regulator
MRATGDMRETILREAHRLFVEQGYAATSIKQIALAAGCATSALYYYFEEGKPQILRTVIHAYIGDTLHLLQGQEEVTSLADLLQRFGTMILSSMPEMMTNNSWLQLEFPRLNEEEKQHVRAVFLDLHRFLVQQIARFVASEEQATQLAWMLVCIYNGYEQLFVRLEVNEGSDGQSEGFSTFVSQTLARGMQEPG